MDKIKDQLAGEKETLSAMVRIYCSGHHKQGGKDLCDDCRQLLDYAFARLDRCRFGIEKPVCSKCTVHCFKPEMREKIRKVMRYSGPRMALRHPVTAICHLIRSLRKS
ncbi:MAG: nitrous oxide-stimulated promoter family protein [Phycisphaerae bacterium]|nr:nitrous oxide-stimulated promoter family protein [Phycisphaerae bacterium]